MGLPADGPEFFEGRMTDYLEEWLGPLDVELRRQNVAPGRDNLLATFHAPNPLRHVLLEVHQDTVPIGGMKVPPFGGLIEGNRVYGRGACDDKGPMTSMLLALKRLATERPANAATVTLALAVDEEFTFLGVQKLVAEKPKFDAAIVAEPTDLDVVTAHKGGARWEMTVRGAACHSSNPRNGVNAIYRMGRALGAIERYAASLFQKTPDPLLGPPTLSVGVIQGGTAVNIVPDACRILIDRRLVPGETPSEAQADFARYMAQEAELDFPVECLPPWLNLPPMPDAINGPTAEKLRAAVLKRKDSCKLLAEPYGSDASTLHQAGIPSVIFGPGSIGKAHTDDEFVPLDEVEMAAEILFDFCAGE